MDSDYDFYVVVPDDAGNKIELSQKAYKSLRWVRKRPVDIVVGYESSFDERAKEDTLEKVVKQEGVLLYEKWKNFERVDGVCWDGFPHGETSVWAYVSEATGDYLLSLSAGYRKAAERCFDFQRRYD